MRIIHISQETETDEWLEFREGKISGTKAGAINAAHIYRNLGFWQILAERLADDPDGESPMERGHRLEDENALIAVKRLGMDELSVTLDGGVWVSDEDQDIMVSPDAYENSPTPSWAIECKSLASAAHLSVAVPYLAASGRLKGFDDPELTAGAKDLGKLLPRKHYEQILQYFVVNPDLKTVYYSLYDPRIHDENLAHIIIPIQAKDVEEDINQQKDMAALVMERVRALESLTISDAPMETEE